MTTAIPRKLSPTRSHDEQARKMNSDTHNDNRTPSPNNTPWRKERTPKKDAICEGCGTKGHWYHECSIPNIDGGMKGCPMCKTAEHPIWECPKRGDFTAKSLWYLFVKARHGLPQFVSCWNPWEIDPERWVNHPEFRPQSVQFTRELELKNSKQIFGSRIEDSVWKKDNWIELVGDQRFPGASRLNPPLPNRKGVPTDAEVVKFKLEEAAKSAAEKKAALQRFAEERDTTTQEEVPNPNKEPVASKTRLDKGGKKSYSQLLKKQEATLQTFDFKSNNAPPKKSRNRGRIGYNVNKEGRPESRMSDSKNEIQRHPSRHRSFHADRSRSPYERDRGAGYRERDDLELDRFQARHNRSPDRYYRPSTRHDEPSARYNEAVSDYHEPITRHDGAASRYESPHHPSPIPKDHRDDELSRAYAVIARHGEMQRGRGSEHKEPSRRSEYENRHHSPRERRNHQGVKRSEYEEPSRRNEYEVRSYSPGVRERGDHQDDRGYGRNRYSGKDRGARVEEGLANVRGYEQNRRSARDSRARAEEIYSNVRGYHEDPEAHIDRGQRSGDARQRSQFGARR